MQKVTGACVSISYLVLGPIENNVYIIGDDAGRMVVDPSCQVDRILDALDGRSVDAIVITHGHWDHTGAAAALRDATGAMVICSEVEAPYINGEKSFGGHFRDNAPCPIDRMVNDGETVEIGSMTWRVIATPGHTPGGMCLFTDRDGDEAGMPVLVSGDTLFAGAHGRVDFEESNPRAMRDSLRRLAELPDETLVLPGHNGVTTIERERVWLDRM